MQKVQRNLLHIWYYFDMRISSHLRLFLSNVGTKYSGPISDIIGYTGDNLIRGNLKYFRTN